MRASASSRLDRARCLGADGRVLREAFAAVGLRYLRPANVTDLTLARARGKVDGVTCRLTDRGGMANHTVTTTLQCCAAARQVWRKRGILRWRDILCTEWDSSERRSCSAFFDVRLPRLFCNTKRRSTHTHTGSVSADFASWAEHKSCSDLEFVSVERGFGRCNGCWRSSAKHSLARPTASEHRKDDKPGRSCYALPGMFAFYPDHTSYEVLKARHHFFFLFSLSDLPQIGGEHRET